MLHKGAAKGSKSSEEKYLAYCGFSEIIGERIGFLESPCYIHTMDYQSFAFTTRKERHEPAPNCSRRNFTGFWADAFQGKLVKKPPATFTPFRLASPQMLEHLEWF